MIDDITTKFGTGAAVRLAPDESFLGSVPGGVSTQCMALDFAIGRPGIPRGRITEISGLEGHGKSTLGVHLLMEAQRRGGLGILADCESGHEYQHTVDLGLDTSKLVMLQPPYLERLFDMFERTLDVVPEDVHPLVFVWDSVAGTACRAEMEASSYDEQFVGLHARVLSSGIKRLVPLIAERKVAFVVINQLRENIDRFGYGKKYKTFGGHALRFHSCLRIGVTQTGVEKKGNRPVGIWCRAKIEKNKVGDPFREATFLLRFDKGIDRIRDLIDCAVDYGMLEEGKGTVGLKGHKKVRISSFRDKILPEIGGPGKLKKMILTEAMKQGVYKSYRMKSDE
ncbi:MAG: hypothetical protein ACXABY_04345 [Candidatus Thorarchaeota archaeon]